MRTDRQRLDNLKRWIEEDAAIEAKALADKDAEIARLTAENQTVVDWQRSEMARFQADIAQLRARIERTDNENRAIFQHVAEERDRLRAALQEIVKSWPDSFAARSARAALSHPR